MQQVRKVFVQHVKHPQNPSRYVGTVAAVIHIDGRVTTGFSQCSPLDEFDKHLGREKAVGRALSGRALNKFHEEFEPVPLKALDHGVRVLLHPVASALELIKNEAKNQPAVWANNS